MWLRELAACDFSPSSLRSYGFDLLRWLRFLHVHEVAWQRAERGHVRGLVEHLRTAPNPQRLRRSPEAAPLDSVNPIRGTCSWITSTRSRPAWTTRASTRSPTTWPGCSGGRFCRSTPPRTTCG
ncbi:site-specific integrase [Nocardia jiangsuensis]|uniref:Site-specific integrase n=1 Tax=Nocardia jiangsuensis TaxID=1691563 RepID=A0ABV8DMB2_9NOCA